MKTIPESTPVSFNQETTRDRSFQSADDQRPPKEESSLPWLLSPSPEDQFPERGIPHSAIHD